MPEQDLDTRIRSLVARAVADAPTAPEIDPAHIVVGRPAAGERRPHRGWWIGGGAALLAAAAAITTVVLVGDTDDRISTPSDTTRPPDVTTVPPVVTTVPSPAFELTEPGHVAAAGPRGVVLRTLAGDLVRRLDRAATIALPVGDGRVVVQSDGTLPSLWLADGSIADAPLSSVDRAGAITAQDVAIVDGRPLLLYVAAGGAGAPAKVATIDLTTAAVTEIVTLPELFDTSRRLHLAANGLVVGELASGTDVVHAVPGSSGEALVGQLAEQHLGGDAGATPLLTVSPDGSWVAWLEGDELVEVSVTSAGLGEQRRRSLPFDTTGAVDVDVLAEGVIVSFGSGQDARYARWDGSFGVLEGTLGTQGPGTLAAGPGPDPGPPVTTTTAVGGPSTTVSPVDTGVVMVTAGADGVAVLEDGVEVRRLDQAAEVAHATPGGAVLFQPARTTPDGHPGDPLIWRPDGTVERLLGELGARQWYRLYDVADVAGVPTVLYGVASTGEGDPATNYSDFVAQSTEVLYALAMAPGGWTTTELTEINIWEAGFSGLSLSADGVVLGTYSASVSTELFTVAIPGSPAAAEGVPDAASLGLNPVYSECADCPRTYAISADGATIGWLEEGDVVVFDVGTGATRRFQHPALAGFPVRLDIRASGPDAYQVVIGMWSDADATPIDATILRLTPAGGSALPSSDTFASFAP